MSKTSYKDTILTPRTEFPMRGDLINLEAQMQRRWAETNLYGKIRQGRKDCPKRVLHDGPPYATGDLHVGTGLNKVLKDFIVRYWTMRGYDSPYLPGWDCHGLPIEHRVATELGDKFRKLPLSDVRKQCLDYAMKFMDRNRTEFKRLGIFGEWDTPYLTVKPTYEAGVIDVFAELVERGYVYRSLRPIHWCLSCETALAEAELGYIQMVSPSVYVAFPLIDDVGDVIPAAAGKPVEVLIWTTTPWTLPANLAIALHPELRYSLVRCSHKGKERFLLLADGPRTRKIEDEQGQVVKEIREELLEYVLDKCGVTNFERLGQNSGRSLEGKRYRHVFVERTGPIVLADYVTLADGTGCVHTAPGHGTEDFYTGRQYQLEAYSPVDNQGRFTDEVPLFSRMKVFEADAKIVAHLEEIGALLRSEDYPHRYPTCWRCDNPVIFRATTQWFVGVEHRDLRKRLLDTIDDVQWVPDWGERRFRGMIENRPDWCISRQRAWGVPIPGFFCKDCGETLLDAGLVRHVRDLFAEHGADYWFTNEAGSLLPKTSKCVKCGGGNFEKENDIFDVWFESGCSHRSVLRENDHLTWPADMYLEGSDQHRGWFQVSFITAMGAYDAPPFRTVLTHGFVVDDHHDKMSKSKGNFVSVSDVLDNVGAELFRLWVSSINYQDDIPTGIELMKGMSDEYRRIRNTFRILLGNLADFDPVQHRLPLDQLEPMDRWALAELRKVVDRCLKAYDDYLFHRVFSTVHTFCTVQLSNVYVDVLKDRLYCNAADSPRRRSGQTAMYVILDALTRLLAPILVHTTEQVWDHIPGQRETESVHLAMMPDPKDLPSDAAFEDDWSVLLRVRDAVLPQIQAIRYDKKKHSPEEIAEKGLVGSSQEVDVLLRASGQTRELIERWREDLAELMIVASVELTDDESIAVAAEGIEDLFVGVRRTHRQRCARCWNYRNSVGETADHQDLCGRCAAVVATG
ncbi:MAG: isoleucine--tRNA ligase [Phycisphaerae bacterium]|nr:isoleucine--tRNA ligase [Phycisphaerae bacterium]